jgi:hypothetical protein
MKTGFTGFSQISAANIWLKPVGFYSLPLASANGNENRVF